MEMYPAMVNSPITSLVSGIDEVATAIEVTDALKLPAGPNIAVIGRGEGAETILYTAKSGNILTGVTRGFQGTARAWPYATEVARYFTAYDYDALRQNLIAHKEEYVSLNITNELMNGWVLNSTGLRLIKSPNTLTVHGNIKDGVVTKFTTIAILPEGIRPNILYRVPVFCFGESAIVVQMNVYPDGRLTVDNNYNWPTALSYYFNFTLPL